MHVNIYACFLVALFCPFEILQKINSYSAVDKAE